MHRKPKELKHLKRQSRLHSAKSQWPGRTSMKVTYKDLSAEEHPQDIFDDILLDKNMDEFDKHYWDYDENYPYEGCTLEDAEEWGFCLPEDYDSQGKYQWPNGSYFGDIDLKEDNQ